MRPPKRVSVLFAVIVSLCLLTLGTPTPASWPPPGLLVILLCLPVSMETDCWEGGAPHSVQS